MEDRDLTASLKAGNAGALEKLIERWRLKAEAYANGILRDPHAAQDAVQEAFARIWALRTGLDERLGFSPYLFTVPEGRYFVLGNHRNNSNDSRFVGAITRDMILGHARTVVFPFDRVRGIAPR